MLPLERCDSLLNIGQLVDLNNTTNRARIYLTINGFVSTLETITSLTAICHIPCLVERRRGG